MPPAERPATSASSPRSCCASWAPPEPDDGGDKHSRGTVRSSAAAPRTPGAVLLAGLAALRAGAGRLQVVTVDTTVGRPRRVAARGDGRRGLPADAARLARPRPRPTQLVDALGGAGTVVLGPGLSGDGVAGAAASGCCPRLGDDVTLVLDAVALTALAGAPELLEPLAARAVLTPNSGELAALLDGERARGARRPAPRSSQRYGAVVSGARLGRLPRTAARWRDEAGGIGLGTSGSGDVLAGLVGGMLARGAEPAQAAVWGQYLHAAAGDRLTARLGPPRLPGPRAARRGARGC